MTEQPTHAVCPACQFDPANHKSLPNVLPLGTQLQDDFVVGRALGSGGFGITYLGFDLKLKRPVAIKEYFPRGQCGREDNKVSIAILSNTSTDDYRCGLTKFLEEAQTLARFHDVPGIVNVGRFFEANNTGYIVMDYLQGITLQEYLAGRGEKIPFDEALNIMMPILDALKEVHAEDLLHRDISPDNIFITKYKQIKLIDFGAARMAARDHSQNFSIILKEGYAPEEQYRSRGKQGPWTDVYALGATLYRCITGQLPPQALDRAAEDERLIPPRESGVNITSEQEQALLKAMAVKASQRFENVQAFQLALLEISAHAPLQSSPIAPSEEALETSFKRSSKHSDMFIAPTLVPPQKENKAIKPKEKTASPELSKSKMVPANQTSRHENEVALVFFILLFLFGPLAVVCLIALHAW